MPGPLDKLLAYLDHFLDSYDIKAEVLSEWAQLCATPSDDSYSRFREKLNELKILTPFIDGTMSQIWEEYRSIINGGPQFNSQNRLLPLLPKMLYKIPGTGDRGVILIEPATADTRDIPFRFGDVSVTLDLLESQKIVVVTGYSPYDITYFFLPELYSRLKKRGAPSRHLPYNADIAQILAPQLPQGAPQTLIFDWDDNMIADETLASVFNYGIISNPRFRILIINRQGSLQSRVWAKITNSFFKNVYGEKHYSVPIIDLNPKYLNVIQVAKFVVGNESEDAIHAARAIMSFIPPLAQYLEPVKKALNGKIKDQPFETIVKKVLRKMGIRIPDEPGAVIVTDAQGVSNLNAADFVQLSAEQEIEKFKSGYEISTINGEIEAALVDENNTIVIEDSVLLNPGILINTFISNPSLFKIIPLP